ncbi:MAG: hypothetical protein Q7R76_01585 [Candidatus Woesearchaeota archaeon]|nr:hypothetical protein [Candidatus Woesearchaeota archaeon]
MAIETIALSALTFLWGLLKMWFEAFFISFTNLNTVWIIVPIWLSWFFAEFFQEKEGTSFGNAISNGVIPFWVGIDWIRQLTTQLRAPNGTFTSLVASKYAIAALALAYGLIIIVYGIKGRPFIRYFGRIREVTYVLAMFTPFVYGLITPSYQYFLAIVLFFPLFYFVIELIDRVTPKPHAYTEDIIGERKPVASYKMPPMPKF